MSENLYETLSFKKLRTEALLEHAESLAETIDEETSLEAIDYIVELSEREEATEEWKEAEREILRSKTKIKKDKATGENIDTGVKAYTDEEIEKLLKDKKPPYKYSSLARIRMYCEKYYPEKIPQSQGKATLDVNKLAAAARARVKAKSKIKSGKK
jgi:hypothetical protein